MSSVQTWEKCLDSKRLLVEELLARAAQLHKSRTFNRSNPPGWGEILAKSAKNETRKIQKFLSNTENLLKRIQFLGNQSHVDWLLDHRNYVKVFCNSVIENRGKGNSFSAGLEAVDAHMQRDKSLTQQQKSEIYMQLTKHLAGLAVDGWAQSHEKLIDKVVLLDGYLSRAQPATTPPVLTDINSHWTNHEALAIYLLWRAIKNGAVDSPQQINELKHVDACVNFARKTLHHGRSNVNVDLKKNPTAYSRMEAGRRLEKEMPLVANGDLSMRIMMANRIAASSLSQAGNCSEHAYQTAAGLLYAKNQAKGRSKHAPDLKFGIGKCHGLDHEWVTCQTAREKIMCADSWQYGPAILEEDARFKSNVTFSTIRINSKSADRALAEINKRKKLLDKASRQYERHLSSVESAKLKRTKVWVATDVMKKSNFTQDEEVRSRTKVKRFAVSIFTALGASRPEANRAASPIVSDALRSNYTFVK